jgi:hypothetical protein
MPGTNLSKYSTAELRAMMKGASPTMKVQLATEIRNRPDGEDMMPSGDMEKPMPKKMEQKKAYGGMASKPKMMKGGMTKKYARGGMANCGASVPPTQKSSKK